MFKDRVFNVSFLISLGWHVFCIFAFVLVITPKGFTLNKFPETSFLGPIVEAGTFQPGHNASPVSMVTPYKEDFAYSDISAESGYGYFDSRVLPPDDPEKMQFVEPVFDKQVPAAGLPEYDKD